MVFYSIEYGRGHAVAKNALSPKLCHMVGPPGANPSLIFTGVNFKLQNTVHVPF